MFEWKDSYSVGVPSIDREHQNLFKMAADLHAAMAAGRSQSVAAPLLDRLVQYTKNHFSHEERVMDVFRYPDRVAHAEKHEKLTRDVEAFQSELNAGRITLTIKLLQFLKNWLVNHIQIEDVKYAPFVKDRDVA